MPLMIYDGFVSLSISGVVNAVQAICALGNLLLLIYFTQREWKHRKNQEQELITREKEIMKTSRKQNWYNHIVMDRVILTLSNCFDEIDTMMEENRKKTSVDERKSIVEVKNKCCYYKNSFVPFLDIFSHPLARETKRLFDDYIDIVTKQIERNIKIRDSQFEYDLNSKKSDILKKIYEYDFDS